MLEGGFRATTQRLVTLTRQCRQKPGWRGVRSEQEASTWVASLVTLWRSLAAKTRHRVVSGEALGERKAILRWKKPECISKLKPAEKEPLKKH